MRSDVVDRQRRGGLVRVAGDEALPGEVIARREGERDEAPEDGLADERVHPVEERADPASPRLEDADAKLGMSPTAMKEGGAGETIRYAVTASPLGRILVGTTERGLCCVLFADNDAEAAADLRERFPQAVLRRDDAGLADAVRFVMSNLRENAGATALPFHVRATAFQERVWQALREIPRGETRTYQQIADAIGSPNAVRAVGTACGAKR